MTLPPTSRAIQELLSHHSYEISARAEGDASRIQADSSNSPIVLNIVVDSPDSFFLYIYIRIRDWDLPGDRTDATFVLSTLLAAFLRYACGLSADLFQETHPAVEGELSGMYIRFSQPRGSRYSNDGPGIREVETLIRKIRLFECLIGRVYDWTESSGTFPQAWMHSTDISQHLTKSLPARSKHTIGQRRTNPNWEFFCCSQFFILKSERIASLFPILVREENQKETKLRHAAGAFLLHGELRNFVPANIFRSAARLCKLLQNASQPTLLVPLDNLVLLFATPYLFGFQVDAGLDRFNKERTKFAKVLRKHANLLFPAYKFEWHAMTPEQFENLVLDLLAADPDVHWIKPFGSTRDRDAGRDFIAEIATRPLTTDSIEPGAAPRTVRQVLVQCKSSGSPIGKAKVTDIRDTVEHSRAGGYLLVVSSYITSQLADHLWELRRRENFWVDWWTRHDLEKRLIESPYVASKHHQVVRLLTSG